MQRQLKRKSFILNDASHWIARFTANEARASIFTSIVFIAVFLCCPTVARAGVSAENVIVVVNGDSIDSRTLANHYVHLREIPSSNVIVLDDIPTGLVCGLDDFKTKILQPLLAQMDARKISAQARVIAYSAGFPTSVTIKDHASRLTEPTIKKIQKPLASLTGLTYFYNYLQADNEGYLSLGANFYARGKIERHFINPFGKGEKRDAFELAVTDRTVGKFKEAAASFEKLHSQSQAQAPIAILAAECFAQAGDEPAAVRMLQTAVSAGWTSARYIENSDALAALIDREDVKTLLDSMPDYPSVSQYPVGFSSLLVWAPNGWPSLDQMDGVRYLPSCMLGVVHKLGSTVDQAVDVLANSATCDRTFPKGHFWFAKTADVRSTTRTPGMIDALLWLGFLKREASFVRSTLPQETGQCIGLMLGSANLDLTKRKWQFIPGALCDNLTSHGGNYQTSSQTKMTDFLHAGAAMTSGSVTEPYAIAQKFPSAMMYGYYASGMTAIESFYSSIASPYQTLIVGDPLAAPFASPPSDRAGFASDAAGNRFQIGWQPSTVVDKSSQSVAMELFIDGKLVKQIKPTRQTTVNLNGAPLGKMPVRLALVAAGPLQSRSVHRAWVQVGTGFESELCGRCKDRLETSRRNDCRIFRQPREDCFGFEGLGNRPRASSSSRNDRRQRGIWRIHRRRLELMLFPIVSTLVALRYIGHQKT